MKMDNRAHGPQIDELLKHTRCCNGDLIRLETSPISRGIGQIVVWQLNNQFDNTIYAISTQAWAKICRCARPSRSGLTAARLYVSLLISCASLRFRQNAESGLNNLP